MVPFLVLSIVFVASGNVPHNETSRLRDSDQLRETQRRYQTLLQSFSQCDMIFAVLLATEGTYQATKTDEFSEKFQTAFDLSPSFSEKSCCGFFPEFMTKLLFIMTKFRVDR